MIIIAKSTDVAPGRGVARLARAWERAADDLGTSAIRFTHTVHEGKVYYLAATVHEAPDRTGLCAALPGHPEHKGDGDYVETHGEWYVRVRCHQGQLSAVTASLDAIKMAAEAAELPVIYTETQHDWLRLDSAENAAAIRITRNITLAGLVAFGASAIAGLALPPPPPPAPIPPFSWTQLDSLTIKMARRGGFIAAYTQNGEAVQFRAELPDGSVLTERGTDTPKKPEMTK